MNVSQPSGKIYIPPYSGVRLIECRDHFQLVPVPAVRTIYGYGKIKSREATIDPDDKSSEPCWDDLSPDQEVWAVMQWYRFADGHQENGDICFLRPECTEEHVRKRMEQMEQSSSGTREEALALLQCHPERFAQEALGHNSKAVHRAYAKRALMKIPSLEDYEQQTHAKVELGV